jgi:hypothetical protein
MRGGNLVKALFDALGAVLVCLLGLFLGGVIGVTVLWVFHYLIYLLPG